MSALKAKMHENRFRLGLRPRPRWGAYSVPQDIIGGFKGLLLSGGYGRGEKERRMDGKGEEGRGPRLALVCPPQAPPRMVNHVLVNYMWFSTVLRNGTMFNAKLFHRRRFQASRTIYYYVIFMLSRPQAATWSQYAVICLARI